MTDLRKAIETVQDMLDVVDSHGSCYVYKHNGGDARLRNVLGCLKAQQERPQPLTLDVQALGGIEHVRELAQAEKDGRMRILPKSEGCTCGSCTHFVREPGACAGTCDIRAHYKDRHGRIDESRGRFRPSQSRKCCKEYLPRKEEK